MRAIGIAVLVVAGVLAAMLGGSPRFAAAPQQKFQAPGFYRMMLGDFEITALNDGVIPYPTAQVLPDLPSGEIDRRLNAMGLSDPVGMSYNAFLINTGDKLILIDTGTGGKLQDSALFRGAGRLMSNLRAAGYRPEQVDEIYITHRGQDHVGGLTVGKQRAFPKAMVRAPRSEFEVFLDPEKSAALLAQASNNAQLKAFIEFTQDAFNPYIQAEKFQGIDGDVALAPGVRAMATPGHTPGHTSYVVESKGQTLVVLGDLVLMGALQFAQPALTSAFDADRKAAAAQRERVLKLASDKDYWVMGGHLSFPGIGHVRPAAEGYRWVPVNYAISR